MIGKFTIHSITRFVGTRNGRSGPMASVKLSRNEGMSNEDVSQATADSENERRKMLSTLIKLTIPLWRAQRRLRKSNAGEDAFAHSALRHLERAEEILRESGIEVKDYLNQPYDPGMSPFIAPVTFQQHSACSSETVIETMTPAVFYRGKIVSKSEVVIGVPAAAAEKIDEPAPADENEASKPENPETGVGTEADTALSAQPTTPSQQPDG